MYEGANYIDGSFQDRSRNSDIFEAVNPSTEEVYGTFPLSSRQQIEAAVDRARVAQVGWRRQSRVARAELFDRLALLIKRDRYSLRDAIAVETGKQLNEAEAEVVEALHMCQVAASMGRQPYGEVYASELPTKQSHVIRKPRGVVAIISPWNFPCAIGSFWCAAPALVEGNTVVHKPSELTPMINQMIAKLYHEAGFPKGVYNLVHGDGTTGATLVRSNVDVILFTGSAEVGQDIRKHCADTHTKTCSVECGSKSDNMVFEDGNLDLAVDVSLASAFKLSGQRCVSASRLLVQSKVFDQFRQRFTEKAAQLRTADPFVGSAWPFYGPLITAEHRDRVMHYNYMTMADDTVKILLHGEHKHTKGYFLSPHVYETNWGNKPFLKEEVFGPHVALIEFVNVEDALRIYNDTDYGLALGVISNDYRTHQQIAENATTGMLYINGGSIAAESHLPFSSWKKSGFGSSAAATWKAVTHTMAVTVNYESGACQFAQGLSSAM